MHPNKELTPNAEQMRSHKIDIKIDISFLIVLIVLAILEMACGPALPRAPTLPGPSDLLTESVPEPTGIEEDTPPPLALYPGDVVTLVLDSAERDERRGLIVDDRGMLNVPLAGPIQVGGIPISEAEQRIETALRRFDRAIRVSLVIDQPNGHLATVLGAVQNPGRYLVHPGMRVTDLLAAAGGPQRGEEQALGLDGADLAGARLVRNGEALPISLPLALKGDPKHNIRVRAGDMLYVPAETRRVVSVVGEVREPQVMPYRPGLRLSQAVAIAGGFTRDANTSDVRIIRGSADRVQAYRASLSSTLDGNNDVVLAPGDVVHVSSASHADL
ncbi:MAG: polysaccharide export protein, partial [Sandaracinaceae bacterium]|nr:polysaccharide export protein [Sandaracinaceae bacterium]